MNFSFKEHEAEIFAKLDIVKQKFRQDIDNIALNARNEALKAEENLKKYNMDKTMFPTITPPVIERPVIPDIKPPEIPNIVPPVIEPPNIPTKPFRMPHNIKEAEVVYD